MEIPKIKTVQVPFGIYDFFGYLLPGIVFGALTLLSFDIPNVFELILKRILGQPIPTKTVFLFPDFTLLSKAVTATEPMPSAVTEVSRVVFVTARHASITAVTTKGHYQHRRDGQVKYTGFSMHLVLPWVDEEEYI